MEVGAVAVVDKVVAAAHPQIVAVAAYQMIMEASQILSSALLIQAVTQMTFLTQTLQLTLEKEEKRRDAKRLSRSKS